MSKLILPNSDELNTLSRRKFLKLGSGIVAGTSLALSTPVNAVNLLDDVGGRELSLYNIHTGEKCKVAFWENGRYIADGLIEINHLLRDHRTGEAAEIDVRLLDLLVEIQQKVNASKLARFEVVSGYRSPVSNSKIRNYYGKGVANHSMHMDGKAADIRLPGTQLEYVKKAALKLKTGGVGYYPRDNFVHVDVGRVRFWTGNKA